MSLKELITGKVNQTKNTNELLENILAQLKLLTQEKEAKYYKEWFPMIFQFYVKGYYVNDPVFGTNKWGFVKLDQSALQLNYDYEFHSLYTHTQERQYDPAFRLVINGVSYPDTERIASEDAQFDDWVEYAGHNYCYERAYRFARIWLYQSNYGYGDYPFILEVKKPWTLNFDIFQTTTSF